MNNNPAVSYPPAKDDTINLGDVIKLITDNWKRMVVGAVTGALFAFIGWSFLATYKAEAILINSCSNEANNRTNEANKCAINFTSWRNLQLNLPLLASQLIADKRLSQDQEKMFKTMSDTKWWTKNVQPTYSLTKADAKDLASIGKELQENGSSILNLVVNVIGSTKEAAEANIDVATQFIKQGSAYLSIKNLIKGYESQILNSDANLQKQIADTERDLKYMRERAKNLESLRQRFPQNAGFTTQQVVDAKDSNAKYMPISTQLVAINTDINNTVESLKKLIDQQAKERTLRLFVQQTFPIINQETNGLKLVDTLLDVEVSMRKATSPEDLNAQLALNDIEATLVNVRTQFTNSLDTSLAPQITRSSPILPVLGGLFGGAIAMLLLALGHRLYTNYRSSAISK